MNKNSKDIILSIDNLSKSYNGTKVIHNLSFNVYKGEILGFLGPNGAGKTTTISMICGLLKVDGGDITINGLSIKDAPKEARSCIGFCPQNIVIWKDLTCLEQIEFMGTMYDIPPREARKRGLELLESMGLLEKKNKRGKTLSGGMQRRLNIILTLIHDPEIVILDEPEAGLDPQSRVLVRDYIKTLSAKKTVILTTHNMNEAERIADRVAIIDGGKLLKLDTPDNLRKSEGYEEILEVKILEVTEKDIENIKKMLESKFDYVKYSENIFSITHRNILKSIGAITDVFESNKISIEDIRLRKKTLEDVFISLTGRGLRE